MKFPILNSSMHREKLELPFELPAEWVATHQVVAVLTGGTEALFLQEVEKGTLSLDRPVYLMASGQSNSLAASLEILCWIQQHGGEGRVITCPEDIALISDTQDSAPNDGSPANVLHLKPGQEKLRLGIVGEPSDWLIASDVDASDILQKMNMELVNVPIGEVTSLGVVGSGMEGAEAICQRLKELVERYRLNGVTLRCFDLLSTVQNTGCLALSRLNDEGIPASCEGDIPLLLTMMLCKQLTGQPGFQVNPCRIFPDGRMLWAHCTVPISMTEKHEYSTHFESGIGVGIHGELPLGDYTLVKLSANLQELLAEDVQLTRNQYEPNLCRTQVWIKGTPALSQRLLTHPLANHHLLIRGSWAQVLKSVV